MVVFRFAPSPNGPLHLGHAFSALLNADMAAAQQGRFLLRIENIDIGRCKQRFETQIFEDLDWLGLDWQKPVLRQSEHFDRYARARDALLQRKLLYPCFCSRRDILQATQNREHWPRDPDGAPHYSGACRSLTHSQIEVHLRAGHTPAFRLNMDEALAQCAVPLTWIEKGPDLPARAIAADPRRWGDVILTRKDVPASYHLCVVLDDAFQSVTQVVRGQDLFEATSLHRLLQELLHLPMPIYFHHPLKIGGNGRKLSKSAGSTALRALRQAGMTPHQIRKHLCLMSSDSASSG